MLDVIWGLCAAMLAWSWCRQRWDIEDLKKEVSELTDIVQQFHEESDKWHNRILWNISAKREPAD
jgi:hypothetical protein